MSSPPRKRTKDEIEANRLEALRRLERTRAVKAEKEREEKNRKEKQLAESGVFKEPQPSTSSSGSVKVQPLPVQQS